MKRILFHFLILPLLVFILFASDIVIVKLKKN